MCNLEQIEITFFFHTERKDIIQPNCEINDCSAFKKQKSSRENEEEEKQIFP